MKPNESKSPAQFAQGDEAATPTGTVSHSGDTRVSATLPKPGKLLRLPSVEDRTGQKKSSIYAGVKARTFPAPVRLSSRAVAWREEDIDRWISERVATGEPA